MTKRTTIIWDWNGTLLDDAEICREAINKMLKARDLNELSIERYRDVFTFPIIDYYKQIGFDFEKEEWEKVAMEFISLYISALPNCKLAPFVIDTLKSFTKKGYRQAIISAMQHDALLKSVSALGISDFFEYIGGIGDHYGGGKIDNARDYLSRTGLNPSRITLIGDTIHDSEVAVELGCNCILVSTGHQAHHRLQNTGFTVIRDLSEVESVLFFEIT
jgi:phosphoglycolate phosphatase